MLFDYYCLIFFTFLYIEKLGTSCCYYIDLIIEERFLRRDNNKAGVDNREINKQSREETLGAWESMR